MMTVRRKKLSAQPGKSEGIAICPVCFGKLRATEEICPHCGAVRHFGATAKETALYSAIGFCIGLALSLLLHTGIFLGIFAVLCATSVGFLVVHSKHGNRWLKNSRSGRG
ncbi:DUF2089 domain-containing protein [Acetobacter sp. AN02]|uniref:hypothetical protein n=1 Tax=Acetobacter sp. AN02 TaxID=2894186 RepID=UPI0024340E3E|nr:hypothetical protein [Acetobacter sp. AN02]MDG6094571.1 DUF2089 domain-containing protein [Acetobacter sp. AN02]